MSNYVISDLHGHFNLFVKLLKKINFNEEDNLYILGDLIDRGKQNLDLYEYIKHKTNIILIKGNHEYMFENIFKNTDFKETSLNNINFSNWLYNGGYSTYLELCKKDYNYKKEFLTFIKNLPLYILLENKFILVHNHICFNYNDFLKDKNIIKILENQNKYDLLWNRHLIDKQLFKNNEYIIIFGHTPTCSINEQYTGKILKYKDKILLDMGVYKTQILACIRLDDMKEFYIN